MSSKTDQAYDLLREKISDATYAANSFIDEKEIAESLGSSRTPVREAIIALAREGYLSILPKRGIIVLPFTYQNASDIFQTRKMLEPWLVMTYGPVLTREELDAERRQIEKADWEKIYLSDRPGISMMHHPHTLLMEKCSNQFITRILEDIEKQGKRIPNERVVTATYRNFMLSPEDLKKEHLTLVELMEQGAFEKAAQEMTRHVQTAEREYMNYWFS